MVTLIIFAGIIILYSILAFIVILSIQEGRNEKMSSMPLWVQKTEKLVKQHSEWDKYQNYDPVAGYIDGLNGHLNGHEVDYSKKTFEDLVSECIDKDYNNSHKNKSVKEPYKAYEEGPKDSKSSKPESEANKTSKHACDRCKDTGIDYLPVKRNIFAGRFSTKIPVPCRCIKRADWKKND